MSGGDERGHQLVHRTGTDHRLDAAGLEQVAGEADPSAVGRHRAERGQEHPRPRRERRRRDRAAPRTPRRSGCGQQRPLRSRAGTGAADHRLLVEERELADAGDAGRGGARSRRSRRPRVVGEQRAASSPDSSAASAPPDRSMPVKMSHAAWASWSVRDSTYHEPAAGSLTRARLDSSCRIDWVLRASRRPKSSGSTDRRVERLDRDRVGAGRPRRRNRPPSCAAGSPTGRAGSASPREVTACWRCTAAIDAAQRRDPGPDPPGGSQLGDRGELVGGHRVPALDRGRAPRPRVQPASVSARR